ncbi:MAG: hypothetical protein LW636_04330 [Planctomycetaceae bacterium]|nr:hypothetical protein [Planctomycetaceae bacterium]
MSSARFSLVTALAAASLAHAEPPNAEAPEPSPYIRSSSRDGYTALEICSREYRRADGSGPAVWLVGVIHIGDERYYDEEAATTSSASAARRTRCSSRARSSSASDSRTTAFPRAAKNCGHSSSVRTRALRGPSTSR